MNKGIIFLAAGIIIFSAVQVFGQEIRSSDLVDLHEKHWAYKASVEVIDKYLLLQGFPDHTFRGTRKVNRYELSGIILKLIRYTEKTKKLKLKKRTFVLLEPENPLFESVPPDHWAIDSLNELDNKYEIVLLPPDEKSFNGDKYVSRYELAFALGKFFETLEKTIAQDSDENPYEKRPEPVKPVIKKGEEWYEDGVKRVREHGIMSETEKDGFAGETPIDRYQLAVTLHKVIQYIEANY